MNILQHHNQLLAIKQDTKNKIKALKIAGDESGVEFFSQISAVNDMKIQALNKVFSY